MGGRGGSIGLDAGTVDSGGAFSGPGPDLGSGFESGTGVVAPGSAGAFKVDNAATLAFVVTGAVIAAALWHCRKASTNDSQPLIPASTFRNRARSFSASSFRCLS